jgi:hypothetical protein
MDNDPGPHPEILQNQTKLRSYPSLRPDISNTSSYPPNNPLKPTNNPQARKFH